uniref:Uncharacterized protein n=1 Tax=Aegilops tauschii subsp. strangulata TaxID=200361 RepID=A0A453B1L3_AEGTS
ILFSFSFPCRFVICPRVFMEGHARTCAVGMTLFWLSCSETARRSP